MTEPLTLQTIQDDVHAWISQWDDGYWPPLANLARMTEEVGELARELNHLHGPKTKKGTAARQDLETTHARIADELSDILFLVVTLANTHNINLDQAFGDMMDKLNIRDARRWAKSSQEDPPEDQSSKKLQTPTSNP